MIHAVIFDMDGLMIDTEPYYRDANRAVASRFGIEIPEDYFKKMMGRKPIEAVGLLVSDFKIPLSPEKFVEERDGLVYQKMTEKLDAMPGLHDFLDKLDGRVKYAVATGSPSNFLALALKTLGIENRFEVLMPSDHIRHGKPDPEIYLTTASRLELYPADCVVLEDAENGIVAAKLAGCYAIAVPSARTTDQDYSRADYVARDLSDAAVYIEEKLL